MPVKPKAAEQRLIRSCASCHARKVKCDAPTKGLPCSRCEDRGETCCLQGRQRRRLRSRVLGPPSACSTPTPDLPLDVPPNPPDVLPVCSHESHRDTPTETRHPVVASEDGPWRAINYNNGIHYLSILTQAVGKDADTPGDASSASPGGESTDPRAGIDELGADDLEYLIKKGVFDLPPRPHLESLLRVYFEFVYPFAPVLDRTQFLTSYRQARYSIFLMQAMLTSAVSHAAPEVISGCGFDSRAAAQQSFFSKAALLCDFGCERGQLPLLQGALVLGTAMVPRSRDKDVRYWFYKSVRLAVGMELHKSHSALGIDSRKSTLFKRIWWVLYSRDILLSLFGTQNIRLLADREYSVGLFTSADWEPEDLSQTDLSILPPVPPQQKLYFVEYCKLALIGTQCLAAVRDHRDLDPETLTRHISDWRLALPDLLVHRLRSPENVWSTVLLAISYRFECILLRLLRMWWRGRDEAWCEWTRGKLHAAIFELDAIAGRTWVDGTLSTLPLSFKSCIHTALAIHIEMALDESEYDTNRAMSQLAIQRSMLLLGQLKEDPVLQQAIPIFERVLAQTNLMAFPIYKTQVLQGEPSEGACSSSQTLPAQQGQETTVLQDSFGEYSLWFKDFLGFDFLDT